MKRIELFIVSVLLVLVGMTAPVRAGMVAEKALGEKKVLVVMTRFPDVTPRYSPDQMRAKYFDKLDQYLRSVSYGKTWVTGQVSPWCMLPDKVEKYRLSPHNLSVDKGKVNKLIRETADAAGKLEKLANYDILFLSLGAGREEYGMMGLCGYPGMLGWQGEKPIQADVDGVAIYCEPAHVGVVFHDLVHILGGVQGAKRVVPCLYDHDLQSEPGPFRGYAQFYLTAVGYFDPMSCHYYKMDQGPPGPCAWTKLRLGWIAGEHQVEVNPGESLETELEPLGGGNRGVLVIRIPTGPSTYYLVENRQPLGADRNLPSHGLLVYACDDRSDECRHGRYPVRLVPADPSAPELTGAPYTMGGKRSFKDAKTGVQVELIGQKGDVLMVRVKNGR